MNITWSEEAIRALGVKTDVGTAGSILGLSRTQSYQAIKDGRFPVEVVRVGRRMIVPTAPIRRLLGIDPEASAPETEPTGATDDAAHNAWPLKHVAAGDPEAA